MELVVALGVLLLVAAVVLGPLRRASGPGDEPAADPRRAELEARKEAKYAEIRDARLDLEAGKLSEADFKRLDRELRAEAIGILKAIDSLD